MALEESARIALNTIETELNLYHQGEGTAGIPRGGTGEAAMAVTGLCRTYRRMRSSIDIVLPTVESDAPGVADLLRFLMKIADRSCRAQVAVG